MVVSPFGGTRPLGQWLFSGGFIQQATTSNRTITKSWLTSERPEIGVLDDGIFPLSRTVIPEAM
jgi:hypothetical protein